LFLFLLFILEKKRKTLPVVLLFERKKKKKTKGIRMLMNHSLSLSTLGARCGEQNGNIFSPDY